MKLTPVQKEALSHTPLFLCQSESNMNKITWMSNRQEKSYQRRTIDVLIEKGLLEHPFGSGRFASPEIDEVRLTDKAIEMGFVENLEDEPTEHDVDRTKKKSRKIYPRQDSKLIKELRQLKALAKAHNLSTADDFISKIIED